MPVKLQDIVNSHGKDMCAGVGNTLAVTGLETSDAALLHVHLSSSAYCTLREEAQLAACLHELAGIDNRPSIRCAADVKHVEHLPSRYRLFFHQSKV